MSPFRLRISILLAGMIMCWIHHVQSFMVQPRICFASHQKLGYNHQRQRSLLIASKIDENDEEPFVAPLPGDEELALTRQEIESMAVPQLKQQLRLRGLKVSGRKTELVNRLLDFCLATTRPAETDTPEIVDADFVKDSKPSAKKKSKARQFAQDQRKELVDVSEYLSEDEKIKGIRSSVDEKRQDAEADANAPSTNPETWGSDARIVDDYEGRSIVIDSLSRTIVEYLASNQTYAQAYVVASRDALKAFLAGGRSGQNETSTAEERLQEIQRKREQASRLPIRDYEEEGLDEGDERGLYKDVINRDYSDWGVYTPTGAQLSAAEVQGVLLLSDVYGPFTNDTRVLADKIAFECQPVVVMVPDLFRGKPWAEEDSSGLNAEGKDYEQWRAQHSDLRVNVDIRAAAATLRDQYGISSVVVWGTCYGGGRALEAASGYFPNDIVHDIDGSIGPPPVDPMVAIAWYPTRYNANILFGGSHQGTQTDLDGNKRNVAVMTVFAENDKLPGATKEDAEVLQTLLEEDERVKDHMVKVFPDQDHGFAHTGLGDNLGVDKDEFERFVDDEFGGAGRVVFDSGDAEVACLLSTAFMETYSRVFLPTTGPTISKDANEKEWSSLMMKDLKESDARDIREEIEAALDGFVDQPSGGLNIDRKDDDQQEELTKLLRSYQDKQEEGPNSIKQEDDLFAIYEKLKATDENFQIF